MTFRVVRTNQYNQDLGLIHSTNGNHLESPNEGSSIDHQVTIYLHAPNITMFPTNETCWFVINQLSFKLTSLSWFVLYQLSSDMVSIINTGAKGISRNSSTTINRSLQDSGHGVCEHMGATHSSQHTVPDAQQFTQPAVARLMRCGSYPLRSQWLTDPSMEMRYTGVTRSSSNTSILEERSRQEESSATTLASVGAVYRRQSEKIRFGEHYLGYRDRIWNLSKRLRTEDATDLATSTEVRYPTDTHNPLILKSESLNGTALRSQRIHPKRHRIGTRTLRFDSKNPPNLKSMNRTGLLQNHESVHTTKPTNATHKGVRLPDLVTDDMNTVEPALTNAQV
ncbi:hypothetical protein F511_24614 [Dorcoceras hygrometricum]|uniref:Uncharacterized protein n=1 Tax=Dorcoceras hygrometricum TaxID=472368 RepID=A0A2Z7B8U5_9LAMI|nr:hypothetical protein F511_24614 [Dorcoceras hygrometricum]